MRGLRSSRRDHQLLASLTRSNRFAKDGDMKLVVLGSGTSVPHPQRTSSAYWLEADGGSLLLDIGPDAAHRMAQEGLAWPALDYLDQSLAPGPRGRPGAVSLRHEMGAANRKQIKAAEDLGPAGPEPADSNRWRHNYRLLQQSFSIEVIELQGGAFLYSTVTRQTFATPPPRRAWRFDFRPKLVIGLHIRYRLRGGTRGICQKDRPLVGGMLLSA